MSRPPEERVSWSTVAGLALGPAVALGFARFAYGLVLPAMRDDLGWSFAEAGTVNTANAIGYLAGAIAASAVSARLGPRTGVPRRAARDRTRGARLHGDGRLRRPARPAFRRRPRRGGRLRRRRHAGRGRRARQPRSGGDRHLCRRRGDGRRRVRPRRAADARGELAAGVDDPRRPLDRGVRRWRWAPPRGRRSRPSRRRSTPPAGARGRSAAAMVSYGLFGAGYIAYATFIVAFLREHGAGTVEVAAFWVVLGVASLASILAWGGVLLADRLRSWARADDRGDGGGRGPPAAVGLERDELRLGAAVRLRLPRRPDGGDGVRSQRAPTASLDGGDRGADDRLRARAVPRAR